VSKERSKIYILVIDSSITPEFLQNLKVYCEAYYTGLNVEIMFPKSGNFLEENQIPNRVNPYTG